MIGSVEQKKRTNLKNYCFSNAKIMQDLVRLRRTLVAANLTSSTGTVDSETVYTCYSYLNNTLNFSFNKD